MYSIGGFHLFENRWMTTTEVERFPERTWRRVYRTHRVDVITWPITELYVLPPNRVYAHPVVIHKLREILESGGGPPYFSEATETMYPPIRIQTSYIYNLALSAWLIIFLAITLIVLWAS